MKSSCLLAATAVFWAASADADVPPPNTEQCDGLDAGVACTTDNGAAGTCETSTCQENAYYADGGRGSVTVSCLVCTADADGGAPDSGSLLTAPDSGPSLTADAGVPAEGSAFNTPSRSSGGCSSGVALNSVGALLIAMLVPLALRRRHRT
jgi:hypothetical protein